jgi:probable phosphoglycerate mutase
LSDLGKLQAERLRDRLANTQELQCDVLYSSGYPRAKETAEIIAPSLSGLSINIDTRFGEHDPGPECDGLTFAEFVRRHGSPDWGGDPSFSQVARPSPNFIKGCTRVWMPLFLSTSARQW